MARGLTEAQIRAQIKREDFYVFPGTTLTVCALTLRNGFVVTGTAACASEASFSYEIGERFAREDAVRKIWELEGYLLRTMMSGRVS